MLVNIFLKKKKFDIDTGDKVDVKFAALQIEYAKCLLIRKI